jgi:ABC-type amino acid transport substrate-binding protein
MVVSDLPIVAWAVSEQAGEIELVRVRLTQEDLAWGFRPQDTQLRNAADGALAIMRQDGRLRSILLRWMPFLDQLERWR